MYHLIPLAQPTYMPFQKFPLLMLLSSGSSLQDWIPLAVLIKTDRRMKYNASTFPVLYVIFIMPIMTKITGTKSRITECMITYTNWHFKQTTDVSTI